MTSRSTLPEQAVRSRDSLVAALDPDGEPNAELIVARTRHLLRWRPSGADRDEWLYQVLPEPRHARRAIRALRVANGGQAAATGNGRSTTPAPSSTSTTDQGQGGRSRRPTRRHRRT